MFDQYILTDMAKEAQSARLIKNRVWPKQPIWEQKELLN